MTEPDAIDQLTFEQALAELENIVQALEQDERPLEESLRLFARGQALLAHCTRLLEQAELQVRQLVGDDLQPWPGNDG